MSKGMAGVVKDLLGLNKETVPAVSDFTEQVYDLPEDLKEEQPYRIAKEADPVSGTITITRFEDRNLPYQINITGLWTVPQIQGIFGALAKANRAHIAKMKVPQPVSENLTQGDGDDAREHGYT